MKEDKAHILRRFVIVITLILIFVTAGLVLVSMQLNTITLNYFGDIKRIKTVSTTVDSFLIENKIYIGENMEVFPSKNTLIENGTAITICSKDSLRKIDVAGIKEEHSPTVIKVEEIVIPIAFAEEKRENPTLTRGKTQVSQEGVEGQKSTKYMVTYDSEGKEVAREELSSSVIKPCINKIIDVGTKLDASISRSQVVQNIAAQVAPEGFKKYNIKLPEEQQVYAYNISKKYGIQYELFLAVMYKESGFNPNAFGGGNSYGLCQIHISNHSNLRNVLGVSDFFNPYDNMTAGAYLLSKYFGTARTQVSGDSVEVYALNAYNMGEGAYYNTCYSKGVLHRSYSNSIIGIKNSLISNGGI